MYNRRYSNSGNYSSRRYSNSGNYSSRRYSNSGNYSSRYSSNNSYPKTKKKRSGASSGLDKDKFKYVRGWMIKNRQLVSILCVPTSKTKTYTNEDGREFKNWMCIITHGFTKTKVSGLYYPDTDKVVIKDWGLVLNPKAPNGGYCGSYIRRK